MLRSFVERARSVAVFVTVHDWHESPKVQQSLKVVYRTPCLSLASNMKGGACLYTGSFNMLSPVQACKDMELVKSDP